MSLIHLAAAHMATSTARQMVQFTLKQSYQYYLEGADPIEFAKEHREFARAFESFPGDADLLYPGWREKLGVHR